MTPTKNKTCVNNPYPPMFPATLWTRTKSTVLVLCPLLVAALILPITQQSAHAQSPDEAVDTLLLDYQQTDIFRRAVSTHVVVARVVAETPSFLDTRLTPPPAWTATAVVSGSGPVLVLPAVAVADMVSLELVLPNGEVWTVPKNAVRIREHVAVIRPARWPTGVIPTQLATPATVQPNVPGIAVSGIEHAGWEVLTKAHLLETAPSDNAPLWISTLSRADGTPLFNVKKQLLAIAVRPGYGGSDRAYVLTATQLRETLYLYDSAEPVRKSRESPSP